MRAGPPRASARTATAIGPAAGALCAPDFDKQSDPEQGSAAAAAACGLPPPTAASGWTLAAAGAIDIGARIHGLVRSILANISSCAPSSTAGLLFISAMVAWAIPWLPKFNKVHPLSVVSSTGPRTSVLHRVIDFETLTSFS